MSQNKIGVTMELESRIEQIKKMKFPNTRFQNLIKVNNTVRGADPITEMTADFGRMGIMVSKSGVKVSLESTRQTYRGKGSTVDAAIDEALEKVQEHVNKVK